MTTDDLVREATVNPSLDDALELAASLQANLNAVVLGTPGAVVAATTAVLAAGHLLIEDVPGVGKTMLAKAVAVSIGTTPRPDPRPPGPAPVRHHRCLDLLGFV